MIKKRNTILVVDDMEINRFPLVMLFKEQYNILEAENGQEAIELIREHKHDILAVLLDVMMPVMNGFEVLQLMNNEGLIQSIPVFLITADNSNTSIREGYDLGATDIISKSVVPYFIKRRIENTIALYEARDQLSRVVEIQRDEILQKNHELQEFNANLIETLANVVEFRDCESGQHVKRIRALTKLLLTDLRDIGFEECINMDDEQIESISVASALHDVGKIAIPDAILNKPGRLTKEEFEIMKTHTTQGCELLNTIPNSRNNVIFKYAYDICRHHHEKWDGRGYPDGLKENEISIWSQVVALADCYDALTTKRCYKDAFAHKTAVEMILNGECGQFNPELMKVFGKEEKRIRETYLKYEE